MDLTSDLTKCSQTRKITILRKISQNYNGEGLFKVYKKNSEFIRPLNERFPITKSLTHQIFNGNLVLFMKFTL